MPVPPDPKVLIVDDQPPNLDALEAMLAPLPCTLVRALSAEEALLRLLQDDFAAIVLDIRMPGMSGLELATLIKQRRRSQHIPILFLTAHVDDEVDVLGHDDVGPDEEVVLGPCGVQRPQKGLLQPIVVEEPAPTVA